MKRKRWGGASLAAITVTGDRLFHCESKPIHFHSQGHLASLTHAAGFPCLTALVSPSISAPAHRILRRPLQYGFKYLPRDPSSFTPCREDGPHAGKHLMFWDDAEKTRASIAQFSQKDADAFEAYEAFLGSFRDVLQPLLDGPPPKASPVRAAWRQRRLKRKEKDRREQMIKAWLRGGLSAFPGV